VSEAQAAAALAFEDGEDLSGSGTASCARRLWYRSFCRKVLKATPGIVTLVFVLLLMQAVVFSYYEPWLFWEAAWFR
jgi:hypothetical protein